MATVNFIRCKKQSRGALGGVKRYVEQEKKTVCDGRQLVSGQNCNPKLADKEFLATRNMHRKDSPVWFYHYTQSFHPQEPITGELAHELAKEFAAGTWPESEVLIATHIDAEHIHSHFIVNAVCYESGKMLRQGPNTLARIRQISDEICQAHGLSVLPPQQKKQRQGMSAREYRSAAKGKSWKFQLMNTIDDCMRYAKTRQEFIDLMRGEGYDIRWTDSRKSITYTTPTGMKCRDDRLHEKKYSKEMMEREFRIREEIVYGGAEAAEHSSGGANAGAGCARADTAHHCDPVPDAGGAGQAGAAPGKSGAAHERAGGPDTAIRGSQNAVPESGADAADPGAAPEDHGAAGAATGWEKERAALFSAFDPSAPAHAGVAGDPGGAAGIAGAVVQLGCALERPGDAVPVKDATVMRHHADRKTLRKEKEKKIALGHKEDDHEDEQTWQQSM